MSQERVYFTVPKKSINHSTREVLIGIESADSSDALKYLAEPLDKAGFKYSLSGPHNSVVKRLESLASEGNKAEAVILANLDRIPLLMKRAKTAAESVRNLSSDVAFQGIVRANSIPILAVAPESSLDDWSRIPWCGVFPAESVRDRPSEYIEALERIVSNWHKSIVDELDNLGYAITRDELGQLDIAPILVKSRREGKILAPLATPERLLRGEFLFLSKDILESSEPIQELRILLNNTGHG